MSLLSFYRVAGAIPVLIAVELPLLLMVGIGINLAAFGHGVIFPYEISFFAIFICPVLVLLAFSRRRYVFWLSVGICDSLAAQLAFQDLSRDWSRARDSLDMASFAFITWVLLLCFVHVVIIALAVFNRIQWRNANWGAK
jgi:hypothetical protein